MSPSELRDKAGKYIDAILPLPGGEFEPSIFACFVGDFWAAKDIGPEFAALAAELCVRLAPSRRDELAALYAVFSSIDPSKGEGAEALEKFSKALKAIVLDLMRQSPKPQGSLF